MQPRGARHGDSKMTRLYGPDHRVTSNWRSIGSTLDHPQSGGNASIGQTNVQWIWKGLRTAGEGQDTAKQDRTFMKISLEGRVALVTGGSRGIGRAVARRFVESGASVAIFARRQALIDDTIGWIGRPGMARGWAVDVTDAAGIAVAVAEVRDQLGPVGILVNNAGSSDRGAFLSLDEDRILADYDLKVAAATRLSRLVIPDMQAARWGRILNMVTVNAKAPKGGGAPTALSRAAGLALTKVISHEFARDNITVNAICLGWFLTDQWQRSHREDAPDLSFEDYVARRARDIPLGRIGDPDEVANLACFLAADAAAYITGAAINIDGGRSPAM